MRMLLLTLMSIVALTAFAQKTLPERFFIECKPKDWSAHILLFVDRTEGKISMKIPILLEEKLQEDADSLYFIKSNSKNYFNKWDGTFKFDYASLGGSNCKILDPDSRQPLFK